MSTCEHCDIEFTQRPRGRRARFCSRACQVAALNARRPAPRRDGTSVRIPADVHRRLAAAAEARDVSIQWLTAKLLTEALDMLAPAEELRITRDRSAVTLDEAVLDVMRTDPDREWTHDDIMSGGIYDRKPFASGVSGALSRLARDGRIVRVARGRYRLTTWEAG